ncbi:MAG: hypothetical protein WC444_04885 [Candidatus Paceibacterota bacterium]
MIDRERMKQYMPSRVFYDVDPNAEIYAGMVAFLAVDGNGVTVATTAPSGTRPIGTFEKDQGLAYERSSVEQHTFDANNQILVKHPFVTAGKAEGKLQSLAGVVYTENVDYTVNLTNGVITRVVGGAIAAGETVDVWYRYTVKAGDTMWNGGTNLDRVPDDTLGSGQITVIEDWAHIWTDQFVVTDQFAVGDELRPAADSRWTNQVNGHPVCGMCIHVPSPDNPLLGVRQQI